MIRKCRVFIFLLMLFFGTGKLFAEGFPAGTLVKVPTHNNGFCYVAIEKLKVGDWIYGVDDKQQERLTLISATTNKEIASSYVLAFESGQELISETQNEFKDIAEDFREVLEKKIALMALSTGGKLYLFLTILPQIMF